MLITGAFFDYGELYIPKDLSAGGANAPTVDDELERYIDTYERELLLGALGLANYNVLKGNIKSGKVIEAAPDWVKSLVNGEEYDGKVWEGLTHRLSPLAAYIYCKWLNDHAYQTTTLGVMYNMPKNGQLVTNSPKYIRAYNIFLEKYQGYPYGYTTYPFVTTNSFGTVGVLYGHDNDQTVVSLRKYMEDKGIDMQHFSYYDSETSLGI